MANWKNYYISSEDSIELAKVYEGKAEDVIISVFNPEETSVYLLATYIETTDENVSYLEDERTKKGHDHLFEDGEIIYSYAYDENKGYYNIYITQKNRAIVIASLGSAIRGEYTLSDAYYLRHFLDTLGLKYYGPWFWEYDSNDMPLADIESKGKNGVYVPTVRIDSLSDMDIYMLTEVDYDMKGNLIKLRYIRSEYIDWVDEVAFEYDDYGNTTLISCYMHDKDGDISVDFEEKYSFEYDYAGNCIKKTKYWEDGSIADKWSYEYDSAGKCIEKTKYWDDESIADKWGYEYDSAGLLTKLTNYDSNGSVAWTSTYSHEYDAAGNLIKETSYDSNGSDAWTSTCSYEYDAAGNLIKLTDYNIDGNVAWVYGFEYDSAGNRIKETEFDSNGNVGKTISYEYDSVGNLINKTQYYRDDSIVCSYAYEYKFISGSNIKPMSLSEVDALISDYRKVG